MVRYVIYRYMHPDYPWLYVGKCGQENPFSRILEHGRLRDNIDSKYWPLVNESIVLYFEVQTSAEMNMFESYLIGKYKPFLNKQLKPEVDYECQYEISDMPKWIQFVRIKDLDNMYFYGCDFTAADIKLNTYSLIDHFATAKQNLERQLTECKLALREKDLLIQQFRENLPVLNNVDNDDMLCHSNLVEKIDAQYLLSYYQVIYLLENNLVSTDTTFYSQLADLNGNVRVSYEIKYDGKKWIFCSYDGSSFSSYEASYGLFGPMSHFYEWLGHFSSNNSGVFDMLYLSVIADIERVESSVASLSSILFVKKDGVYRKLKSGIMDDDQIVIESGKCFYETKYDKLGEDTQSFRRFVSENEDQIFCEWAGPREILDCLYQWRDDLMLLNHQHAICHEDGIEK